MAKKLWSGRFQKGTDALTMILIHPLLSISDCIVRIFAARLPMPKCLANKKSSRRMMLI